MRQLFIPLLPGGTGSFRHHVGDGEDAGQGCDTEPHGSVFRLQKAVPLAYISCQTPVSTAYAQDELRDAQDNEG